MTAEVQPVTSAQYVTLTPGEPAPWFHQKTAANPTYAFHSVGGRYIVLGFIQTASDELGRQAFDAVTANQDVFDDSKACFFGVSVDPADETRLIDSPVGVRFFRDYDARVSRLYGALPRDPSASQQQLRRFWLVLDPTLRVMALYPMVADGKIVTDVFDFVRRLQPPSLFAGVELQAPILYLPNVFDPQLCQDLISLYDTHGGDFSGFMREQDGITVGVRDPSFKSRSDYTLTEKDKDMMARTQAAVIRRVVPEIKKVHQFAVTRMERYIVGCYTAEDGGHFRAHRDNTTAGTAHRRFAVSINLNDDFDGGTLSFPEYGQRQYKPPAGAAVVFSCSLLHAVAPVTRGNRYAFLPFLYDDAAANLRQANLHKLSTDAPLDLRAKAVE
jgi:predicted 2-oxoglutarate/Fe(II)-dependent dioxygenase YbiX/peroxiredoxin